MRGGHVREDLPESPKLLLERPDATLRNESGRMSLPGLKPRSSFTKAPNRGPMMMMEDEMDDRQRMVLSATSDQLTLGANKKAKKARRHSASRAPPNHGQ